MSKTIYSQIMNIIHQFIIYQSMHIILIMALAISTHCFTPYTNFTPAPGGVNSVNFSPDGSLLAAGLHSNNHFVYSFSTLQVVFNFSAGAQCNSVRFSPDQNYIAFGLASTTVVVMNSTYNIINNITTQFANFISEIDFSSDSTKLLVCGKINGGARGYEIWSIPGASLLSNDYSYTSDALSCRFSPNGTFAVGDNGGRVYYYYANFSNAWIYSYTWSGGPPSVLGVSFSPNGSVLGTTWGTGNGRVVLIFSNLSNGSNATNVGSSNNDIKCLHFSYDGTVMITGDSAGILRIHDALNGYLVVFNISGLNSVNEVYFSYDSCWIAAGNVGGPNKLFLFTGNCYKNQAPNTPVPHCPIDQFLNSSNFCQQCVVSMAGCRKCQNGSYCTVCTDQYYLNSSNLCSPCSQLDVRCIECSDASTCTRCIATYYLNGSSCSLCFSAMPGCLACLNSTYCTLCATNNYYFNATSNSCFACSAAMANCVECSSSATCIVCQPAYFVNSGGSCSKCSINCSACSNASGNCSVCDHGFYLSGAACPPCPINCSNCTGATTCTLCTSGYFLSGTSCPKCSYYCQTCVSSASNCLSCNIGYYLNGNTCSLCNTNCSSCVTAASTCLSCNTGFYLNNSTNTCVSCTSIQSNCLLCNSSACYQCSSGYFVNGTTCYSCLATIAGCQICSTNTTCLLCAERYYLSSGNCTPCTWPCLTCANSTSTGCLSCAIGYYLNTANWTCLKCNCPTCNSSNNCLSCPHDQYLSSGVCYYCTSIHAMCRSCDSSSSCLQCTPPYYLNGANCSLCASGCSNCTSPSVCVACTLGYYLATSSCTLCPLACSACVSNSNCTMCVEGYYLSGGACLNCSAISPGCAVCNWSACLACSYLDGYYLSSTSCATCQTPMPHCKVCTASNMCVQCQISYALNNSNSACALCSTLMPFCQLCTNTTRCTQCLASYYYNGTNCIACSYGCMQCSSGSICIKCLPSFWLTGTFTCTQCASVLLGCDRCSSSAVCIQCGFGFYLSGGTCTPCLASLNGCLACNSSAACIACQNGYYLNSSSGSCAVCGDTMTGCAFCRSLATCDICLSGYYLNAGNCSLCPSANCLSCNSTTCVVCESGYYKSGGGCSQCVSLFAGCVMCNSSTCQSCISGYFVFGSGCSKCTKVGCSVCNNTNPNQCLTCSSTYYLSVGFCLLCNSTLANCIKCTPDGLSCIQCAVGYFINALTCALCSTPMPYCSTCSTAAICDSCISGSLLTSPNCTLCKTLMDGCMFCTSSVACANCQQGYFMNSSSLCQRCSIMAGCLICRNSNSCSLCTTGYFLSNGLCSLCNSTMAGCIACSSSSTCIACEGNYNLTLLNCNLIRTTVTYYPYKELKLVTAYVNVTTLKHTLWVTGSTFAYTNADIALSSNISYVLPGGTVVVLAITGYEWGQLYRSIIFYTDNPFDMSKYSANMKLFSMRLLQETEQDQMQLDEGQQRQLQTSSLTNLDINADFQLTMDQATVLTILPASLHRGNLYLTYSADQPEFLASVMIIFSYNYHLFGMTVAIYLLGFYFVKGVVLDPKGKDKGQLVAHILLLKTPVLMLYPTYAQLLDYCSGYMLADLPWLNSAFAGLLADPRDNTPSLYLLFYTSLNLASTFLLPVQCMILCYVVLWVVNKLVKDKTEAITNMGLVIYNYFLGGLSFATAACIQGALLNPMQNQFSLSSMFYIIGIAVFFVVLGQAVWSTIKDRQNLFKLRIILKSVLLSVMHYNALYLFAIVLGVQAFFLLIKIKISKMNFPKLWVLSHILPNISLLMLVQLSRSLLSIYVSAGLVLISLAVEMFIVVKQYKLNKMISEVRISQIPFRQGDYSFMKTLDMFVDQQQKANEPSTENIQIIQNQQIIFKTQDNMNVGQQQNQYSQAAQRHFFAVNQIMSDD